MPTPANSINEATTGITGFTGTAFTGTAATQYNVLVGGASSSTLANIAPSATVGVPLVSQGASTNPHYGTAVVAGGGTGAVTLTGVLTGNGTSAVTANAVTQHGVVIGGASNAVSSTAVGATGTVLIGNTGADPTYSAAPTVTSITFGAGSALGTYSVNDTTSGWTPVITSDGTPPTITYGVQRGSYVKIGQIVHIQCLITFASYVAGTGNIQLTGLPFTTGSSLTFPPGNVLFSNVTFAGNYCVAYASDTNTYLGFYAVTTAAGQSQLQSTALQTSSTIAVSMTYISNT